MTGAGTCPFPPAAAYPWRSPRRSGVLAGQRHDPQTLETVEQVPNPCSEGSNPSPSASDDHAVDLHVCLLALSGTRLRGVLRAHQWFARLGQSVRRVVWIGRARVFPQVMGRFSDVDGGGAGRGLSKRQQPSVVYSWSLSRTRAARRPERRQSVCDTRCVAWSAAGRAASTRTGERSIGTVDGISER